jgi:hypothetical protein
MGMQQKLDKAHLRGQIQGATETWQLMEEMFLTLPGIGPKTREKILREIGKYANEQRMKELEKDQ